MRRLDRTDRNILAALQADGRMTLTELATRVALSVSRTQRRVRELESARVITGYHADVDEAATGFGFEVIAFVVVGELEMIDSVDAALDAIPQVVEAKRLFGEPDYMIRVKERDLEAYQRLYDARISKIPGIARVTSTIVMKNVVSRRPAT